MRKPIVVAIANILFPGSGYVLLGKRTGFGLLAMLAVAIQAVQLYIDPLPYVIAYGSTHFSAALGISVIVILDIALAYDAYTLAKQGRHLGFSLHSTRIIVGIALILWLFFLLLTLFKVTHFDILASL
ncbi:MAG TPA: hypothetical protein VG102_02045 [Candidatus Paceibacterota bacterium]|jgi:uncharacterized membrane protein YidH (DUF202 family)|nr:hypothetical protein [Candidatus Paceibacterota bacterium]